ncbi:MAG TPA: alpha/beta hydrolase [Solirubrobacteraceae bacterium]|nr:alpha/beta hydrolase [Solirubrobacteraceae bacterium]
MPVHPQVQEIVERARELPEPDGVEEAREQYAAGCMTYVGMAEPVERVSDEDADGVRVRVFVPKDAPEDDPLPGVLWIHGGGWILGTIDAHDALCRALGNAACAVVVSVDYRLAPEHQHPAQLEDCATALRWMLREAPSLGVDPARVAVAGDSAGGNLAAVLARRFRDEVVFQLLVYPATDARCSSSSYSSWGAGNEYGLSRDHMAFCWEAYAPGDEAKTDPDVSPLLADDLAGVPPALVISAEYDPLKDEGVVYAERLREAGVEVRAVCFDGMVHGFFRWRGGVDAAHEAMEVAAGALRDARALSAQT